MPSNLFTYFCQHSKLLAHATYMFIFSRPGQSQGLLYKHLCHSLFQSVTPKWFFQLENRLFPSDEELSKSRRASKSHQWFKIMAILLKGRICILVLGKLHQEGSAPADCAGGLFFTQINGIKYVWVFATHCTMST